MGTALITDLYELNMAASYLRRGMVGPAAFSLRALTDQMTAGPPAHARGSDGRPPA